MLLNHHTQSFADTLDGMGILYTEYPLESLRISNGLFIHGASIGVNSSALSATTSQKETIISFLDRSGVKVIPTEIYYQSELVAQYGAPLQLAQKYITKPNRGHGGLHNRIFLSPTALDSARDFAGKQPITTLVEVFIEGYEVRVLSVKGDIIQTIKKTPLILVGDEISDTTTLYNLLTSHYLPGNATAVTYQKCIEAVKKMGISQDFVLELGEELDLTQQNYSAISLYSHVEQSDPEIQRLHDLVLHEFPLQFAGMDFLVDANGDVWYLETNTRPGLRMFELFDSGVREKVLKKFVTGKVGMS